MLHPKHELALTGDRPYLQTDAPTGTCADSVDIDTGLDGLEQVRLAWSYTGFSFLGHESISPRWLADYD